MNIWKYPFEINDVVTIEMPTDAKILSIQYQRGVATLWAIVDPLLIKNERTFRVFGTGHSIQSFDGLDYIATIQDPNWNLVWHVFEKVQQLDK